MFTLIRSLPVNRLLTEQLPAIGRAWLAAEMFSKFRSFSREMLAFMATWFVIDGLLQGLRAWRARAGLALGPHR